MSNTPTAIDANENGLNITWSNGQITNLNARTLRINCNCASCVSEISGERTLNESRVPQDITLTGAQPTGNYAISLAFSDGHATGIYTYEHLRGLSS
ncbi:MAG: DUF971 domain-containing protein [Deltaproteobacteria bacterium]|nr:DUF971 domain-containing protein [Deltaproteobacteria bacterium]